MLKRIMKKILIGTMVVALGMPPVSTQGAYLPKTDVNGKTTEDISIENPKLQIGDAAEVYQSAANVQESGDNVRTSGVVSGKCGENVTYELNIDTGTVTIHGTGTMNDYKKIEDSPFYAYSQVIQSVTIQEGVTSVGANVFGYCFYLEKVTLPQSLTSIGECAFLSCVSMGLIEVPESVSKIGSNALGYYLTTGKAGTYSRSNLVLVGTSGSTAKTYANRNNIDFVDPAALDYECGYDAFWSFDMDTGVLTISGKGDMTAYDDISQRPTFDCYKSRITSVVIEEGIKTISRYTFKGYDKITEVTIPESMKGIAGYAFHSCTNLQKINLPESLESVYAYAFSGCTKLEKITLPENLTSIKEGAFYGCENLQRVRIPKNVKTIENSAFVGCSSLTAFEVDEENETFSETNGVLFADNSSLLHIFPEGYEEAFFEVPEGMEGIGSNCFTGLKHLKSLLIHNESAFYSYNKYDFEGVNVYYDGEEEITEEILAKWNGWGANFINANEISGLMEKDTLSIYSKSKELSMGESIQLLPEISPKLAADFIWTSSDENVAVVSDKGLLIAVNPGTTTIQVKTADNQYSAEATFQVTGTAFTMEDYQYMELSEDLLKYTSPSIVTKQIVSEKLHGIYFLNGKELSFYSFVTENHQVIDTFKGCDSAYVTDDTLYILYDNVCYTYDLITRCIKSVFHIADYSTTAVGADYQGRIYISGSKVGNAPLKKIFLYSPEGEKLSELPGGATVYEFSGFDSTNGCFYMESYFNYRDFGYSYPGQALTMGQVIGNELKYIDTYYTTTNGMISTYLDCILYLFQNTYMKHQTSAELLGNKYLVATSAMHNLLSVMDSNSAGEQGIGTLFGVNRVAEEVELENDYYDTLSIGTRAVYNEKNDSIVLYENNKTINEYSPVTQNKIATFQTQHNVFNFLKMGESIIAIEKEDDKFYMEIINWKNPGEITLQPQSAEMPVGTTQKITPSYESFSTKFLKWSSSDNNIATVSQNGIVSAWKEGTVVITGSIGTSMTASITITVTPSQIITPRENTIHMQGAETNNVSDNNYDKWTNAVASYLVEKTDGTFEQIENLGEDGVQIKTYTKDLQLESCEVIPKELEIFGGFYSGENANFLVFGQENPAESDAVEVIRIVKYSKDWKRIDVVSVEGANTSIPFHAGAVRMTETAGKLYIHTSHQMYVSEDGENHQANMTFVLDEETLEIEQSYYDIANMRVGYVSHSLNQFVETDGEYVYRVDHGDAAPRAMVITKCKVGGAITDVMFMTPFAMQNSNTQHYNYTGASIGGFELSKDNCLIIGNSKDQTSTTTFDNSKQWNIFLTVTNKNMMTSKIIWLTHYPESYDKTVRTPHLIKLNEEQFLVMWEEVSNQNMREGAVKMLTINSDGEVCSEIKEVAGMKLSDCKPVLTADGLVKWYVTNGEETIYYTINPYQLSAVKDDTHDARQELYTTIEEGAAKEAEKYTADSWAIFEVAYNEAVNLLEREDLTVKEIMAAKEKLENAMDALVRTTTPDAYEVAREELYAVMRIAYSKIKEDYTADSWNAFETVYNEAKNFSTNNKKVEEIIAMKDRLEAAINALVPITTGDDSEGSDTPDSAEDIQLAKERLYAVVNTASHKLRKDYTEDSWNVFEAVYNEARNLLANNDVTVKQIMAMKDRLEAAINVLVPAPPSEDDSQGGDGDNNTDQGGNGDDNTDQGGDSDDNTPDDTPDSADDIQLAKEQLYAIIRSANNKMPKDYTADSWKAFEEVYNEARSFIQESGVTVKEIIAMKEKLEKAIHELVPLAPPEDDSQEGNGSSGEDNGQNDGSNQGNQIIRNQLVYMLNEVGKDKSTNYTADSWNAYMLVYNEVERMLENENATKEQLLAVKTKFQNALSALVYVYIPEDRPQENKPQEDKPQENKPQENKPQENVVLKPGETFKNGNYKFKIKNNKEVIFTGVSKKTSKVKIPNTVTYKGKVLKVTSVAAKALRNNKVVTQITVGTNITTIGKSAFEKCKKLQKIIIKSTKLKTVQKKAFSGIKGNAKITVPKKYKNKYKKLLKNKGQGKKVMIV